MRLSATAWAKLRRHEATAPPGKSTALKKVQSLAADAGTARLYVHAADTNKPVALSKYVLGLPQDDYWFDGPAPLELIVSFPRPKFTSVRRSSATDLADQWTRSIHQLPIQQAVVQVRGSEPEIIRIVDVEASDGSVFHPEWTAAARRAGAQSWEEIAATAEWRTDQVDNVAAGRGTLLNPLDTAALKKVRTEETAIAGKPAQSAIPSTHETPINPSSDKTVCNNSVCNITVGDISLSNQALSNQVISTQALGENSGDNPIGEMVYRKEPPKPQEIEMQEIPTFHVPMRKIPIPDEQMTEVSTIQEQQTMQCEVDEDGSIA